MFSKVITLLGIKGLLLFVGFLVSGASLAATSQDVFCLSCHEMRSCKEELSRSPHAKDASGNPIGCAQCHVSSSGLFSMLETKVAVGASSLWTHFMSEKLLLDRSEMRETARKYVADANCRACHENLLLNAAQNGPVSPKGQAAHLEYLKKNPHPDRGGCSRCHGKASRNSRAARGASQVEVKGCVSCHENVAHGSFSTSKESGSDR